MNPHQKRGDAPAVPPRQAHSSTFYAMLSINTINGQLISPIPRGFRYFILGAILVLPIALYIGVQFLTWSEIFGSLLVLFVVTLTLFSFQSGLMLLLAFLPFEPLLLKFVPADISFFFRLIPEAIIYSLFLVAAVRAAIYKNIRDESRKKVNNPLIFALFLLAGLSLISALVNRVDPIVTAVGVRQIFRFIILYVALTWSGLKNRQIMLVLGLVAAVAALESALGLLQAAVGSSLDALLYTGREFFVGRFRVAQEIFQVRTEGSRVFATMGRYDQLGTFLSLVAAAALGFVYRAAEKYKKYALLLLLIILPALFLTYSRASWFGFLLGLIVVAIIIQRDKKVLAALMIVLVSLVGYTAFREIEVRRLIDEPSVSPMHRLLEAFSERRLRSEYTGKGRVYFIIETPPAVLRTSPLLGMGPGQYGGGAAALLHNTAGYDELNLPFGVYGTEGQVDNNWMSLLGELGLLGVLVYLSIFISLILFSRKVLKDPRSTWLGKSLALGLIAATVSFAAQGFLGTYFEMRTLATYYWLLAGLTVVAAQSQMGSKGEGGLRGL